MTKDLLKVELPLIANAASDTGISSGGGTGFTGLAIQTAIRKDTTERINPFIVRPGNSGR